MRKKISLSGFLILLVFLTSLNMIVSVESETTGNENYACSDLTAPDIFLFLGNLALNGNISGFFYDAESQLDASHIPYAISINEVYLNSTHVYLDTNPIHEGKRVNFQFNVSDFFDTTPDIHNNISMMMYNLNNFTYEPSLKQGSGTGGGGGFGFCDTEDCWTCPTQVKTRPSSKGDSIKQASVLVDNTAPIVNISLVNFTCCGQVTWATPYDPDQVDEFDVILLEWPWTYGRILETMNLQYIQTRIIIDWYPGDENIINTNMFPRMIDLDPSVCPLYSTEESNVPLLGSLVLLSVFYILVVVRKRKRN